MLEQVEINRFCLKFMSRISHKWYFYLLAISAYILKVIYSFQLFICYCMNVWVTIWHFCTVESFIYVWYMNNLLCDMLFTTVFPNFLCKVVYLNWFFRMIAEWSLLPVIIWNLFRSHRRKIIPRVSINFDVFLFIRIQ